MSKPSAEERARTAKAQAEAREADANAKLAAARTETVTLLRDLLTDVARSPNVARPGPDERLGEQKSLRKFSLLTWVKVTPAIVARFVVEGKIVPDDFWAKESVEEHGEPVAVVACPCGAEPSVAFANYAFCDGEDCNRVFAFDGKAVRSLTLTDEEIAVLEAT